MFKNFYKITTYLNESRNDLKLDKRKMNYRFNNKVVYVKDQTILFYTFHDFGQYNMYYYKYWYKYLYCINYDEEYHFINSNNILYRKNNKKSKILYKDPLYKYPPPYLGFKIYLVSF
jgi:hypothetical protein